MPGKRRRGFTDKEDRMARYVANSERKRGLTPKRARSVGYATIRKQRRHRRGQ